MSTEQSWYVAVEDVTAGPAATELVIRGIEHRKIPPEAVVCPVGAHRWDPLSSVEAFHAAVLRSYPPPPPDSEEARRWLERGFHFTRLGALPRIDYTPARDAWDEVTPVAKAAKKETSTSGARLAEALDGDWDEDGDDLELELDVVDTTEPPAASGIDLRDPFQPFFLIGDHVELPDEQALLSSLRAAPPNVFDDEPALWNLALCLAYGSDAVAAAAARAVFDSVPAAKGIERFQWIQRALQGNGFVHSGIPAELGARGVRELRSMCPPAHARLLS